MKRVPDEVETLSPRLDDGRQEDSAYWLCTQSLCTFGAVSLLASSGAAAPQRRGLTAARSLLEDPDALVERVERLGLSGLAGFANALAERHDGGALSR